MKGSSLCFVTGAPQDDAARVLPHIGVSLTTHSIHSKKEGRLSPAGTGAIETRNRRSKALPVGETQRQGVSREDIGKAEVSVLS